MPAAVGVFVMPLLVIFLPFLPAGLMLLVRTVSSASLAERILALALALFCMELAHMAFVDLRNISAVAQQSPDPRLQRFRKVTYSTIVSEVVGFYIALGSLPIGALIIIASQLWFNSLAGIQLWPKNIPAVVSLPASDRLAVLIANGIGIGLLGLWPIQEIRTWSASGLLILITLFLAVKYSGFSQSSDISQ